MGTLTKYPLALTDVILFRCESIVQRLSPCFSCPTEAPFAGPKSRSSTEGSILGIL